MDSKKSILFITPRLKEHTGGKVLSDNIHKILEEKYNVVDYFMMGYGDSIIKKTYYTLLGYTHGSSSKDTKHILEILTKTKIDVIIFNHSYYGNIIESLKAQEIKIPIITYFHNVESKFHLDIVKRTRKISNWLTWKVLTKNERKSALFSDATIGLNQRDNDLYHTLYHKNFNELIPMFLYDRYHYNTSSKENLILPEKFGLFVGSLFFANYYGIKWFAKEVCPEVELPMVVAGKGFEKVKEEFSGIKNLIIVGEVEDLSSLYKDAEFIISPIFDGSGMKTKTAEAWMYGKYIIGTAETFEGYDIIPGYTGSICMNKDEFITAINDYSGNRYNNSSLIFE